MGGHVGGPRVVPSVLAVDDEGAVDREPEGVIARRDQLGLLDLRIRRQSPVCDEQAMAFGFVGSLVARVPDPLGPAERGLGQLYLARSVGADPLGPGPVRRIEQSHRPERRLAPGRGAAVLVPGPHLPVARLMRRQRLAGIHDGRGLVALDAAAIPEIALVADQGRRIAGYQDMIGGLLLTALRQRSLAERLRGDDPAQSRRLDVDTQRILAVFAAEIRHGQAAGPFLLRAGRRRRVESPAHQPEKNQPRGHGSKHGILPDP